MSDNGNGSSGEHFSDFMTRERDRLRGKAARGGSATAGRQQRVRRGSRREELLNLIREGNGLSRGEILDRMGLKGDKSGEMSVSNALTALTKRNQVRREGGKYLPAS